MMISAKKRITERRSPVIVATWQSKFDGEQIVAISRNQRNVKSLVKLTEWGEIGHCQELWNSRESAQGRWEPVTDEKVTQFEKELDKADKLDIGFIAKMEDDVIRQMRNTFWCGFHSGEKTEQDIRANQLFSEKKYREAFELLGLSPAENINFAINRAFADDWFETSYEDLCATENAKLKKAIQEADMIERMNNDDLTRIIFEFSKLPRDKLLWGFQYPTFDE